MYQRQRVADSTDVALEEEAALSEGALPSTQVGYGNAALAVEMGGERAGQMGSPAATGTPSAASSPPPPAGAGAEAPPPALPRAAAPAPEVVDPAAETGGAAAAALGEAQAVEAAAEARAGAVGPGPAVADAGPVEVPDLGAAADGDAFAQELWEAMTGATPEEQAAEVRSGLGGLAGLGAALVTDLQVRVDLLRQRLAAAVEQQVQVIRGALASAEATVRQGFAQARSQVESSSQAAVAAIQASMDAASGSLEASAAQAQQRALTGLQAESLRLASMRERAGSEGALALQAVADELRGMGADAADRARSRGAERAAAWRGASASEDIEREKNEARAKAAEEVSAAYAGELPGIAEDAANQLLAAVAHTPGLAAEIAAPAERELGGMQAGVEGDVSSQLDTLLAQVREVGAQAIAQVEEQRTLLLDQIAVEEEASLEQLRAGAASAEADVREAGALGDAHLVEVGSELVAALREQVAALVGAVGGTDLPDPSAFEGALAEASARLAASQDEALSGLEDALTTIEDGLRTRAERAAQDLGSAASLSADNAATAAAQLGGALAELAAARAADLDALVAHADEGFASLAEGYVQGGASVVDRAGDGLQGAGALQGEIDAARRNLRSTLDGKLSEMESDIDREAEEAAAEVEASSGVLGFLGSLASIVVNIAVFVVVAAAVVAIIGTGPLALIAAGAIAGAAAALVGLGVEEWITGESKSWRDYAHAAFTGAVVGAIAMFVGGPAAERAITGMRSLLALAWGGAAADQISDMLIYGESFNLGEFLVLGIVSSLTIGLLRGVKVGDKLNDWFRRAVFRGPNSWNTFQRVLARIPGLRGLTPSQRSTIYRQVKGLPGKFFGKGFGAIEWLVLSTLGLEKDPDKADDHGEGSIGYFEDGSGVDSPGAEAGD